MTLKLLNCIQQGVAKRIIWRGERVYVMTAALAIGVPVV